MTTSGESTLRDTYGRAVTYLRVSVTDRCNLRCFYCLPREHSRCTHPEQLTLQEMAAIVRTGIGLGIRKVRITGGEPLVRPGVLEFIRTLSDVDGLDDLALSTNGTLLAESAAALRAAGLRRVNVSLDSLRPAVFQLVSGRNDLPRVLDGIRAAREAGLAPVKVNVVVMRGINDEELSDMLDFGVESQVQIRFIEYMPFGLGQRWEQTYVPRDEILGRIASHLATQAGRRQFGDAATYYPLRRGGEVGVISPISCRFCDICNRLRLTADGRLRPCLTSEGEVDVRPAVQAGPDLAEIADCYRRAALGRPQQGSFVRQSQAEADPARRSMAAIGG